MSDSVIVNSVPVTVVPQRASMPAHLQTRPTSSTLPRETPSRPTPSKPVTRSNSHYIPISECSSQSSARRNSIPDELAPPPPPLKAPKPLPQIDIGDNDVFDHQQVYDMPPRRKLSEDDNVYKVPPPRNYHHDKEDTLDVYDVPPPARQSPSTPRSSSSESQAADSAYSSQPGLTYDYPPSGGDRSILSQDDVYDVPPPNPQFVNDMNTDVPPPRPPKSSGSVSQEPYQNLPPNSKAWQDFTDVNLNKVVPPSMMCSTEGLVRSYDVPRSQFHSMSVYDKPMNNSSVNKDSSLLAIPPPPKSCDGPTSHSYVNANKAPPLDDYLPMDAVFPEGGQRPEAYADMSGMAEYDTPRARSNIPQIPPRASPRAKHTVLSGRSFFILTLHLHACTF